MIKPCMSVLPGALPKSTSSRGDCFVVTSASTGSGGKAFVFLISRDARSWQSIQVLRANLTGASCVCGSPGASTRNGFVGESTEL
ncbi:hypothetical protein F2Q69_00049086 [Brassica cretica]|uniref:Uncharacterized protein n=1 Tax=Brassica cretica TaxID=69181 RepID=A0A8S9Q0C6_BRACR|nr:hypothetical protein F2Q69_00049086 [Brassica cretica]